MNTTSYADRRKWLAVAIRAAHDAGRFLSLRKGRQVLASRGKDIKIAADRKAERVILRILKRETRFPVFSEEAGMMQGTDGRCRWIVDPLDGSLNFSRDIPLGCVSIALEEGGKPVLGVIYDFYRDELFSGIAGVGAWRNGKSVRVSRTRRMRDAVLVTGFPVRTDFSPAALTTYIRAVRAFKKIRLLGSAALSLAYVACGRADAYFEKSIHYWDVAAGLAILEGAGGFYRSNPSRRKHAHIVYGSNNYLRSHGKIFH